MKRIRNDRYLLGNQCLKRERGNGESGEGCGYESEHVLYRDDVSMG